MYSTAKKYQKFGRDRLLKLAQHLQKGELAHKKFDFEHYNTVRDGEAFDSKGCGTLGCAVGELPALFPTQWKFGENFEPTLRTDPPAPFRCPWGSPLRHAAYFFGIDYLLAEMLFLSYEPRPWARDRELSDKATRRDVATSIMNFIKWYDPKVQEALDKQERCAA